MSPNPCRSSLPELLNKLQLLSFNRHERPWPPTTTTTHTHTHTNAKPQGPRAQDTTCRLNPMVSRPKPVCQSCSKTPTLEHGRIDNVRVRQCCKLEKCLNLQNCISPLCRTELSQGTTRMHAKGEGLPNDLPSIANTSAWPTHPTVMLPGTTIIAA